MPDRLSSCGVELDLSPSRFGPLLSSADLVDSAIDLRARMEEDGYLYLPGFLDRGEVLKARLDVLSVLREEGCLEEGPDWREALARPGLDMAFRPDLANGRPQVRDLLYSEKVMSLYADLFGEPALAYDYTWLRAVAPGKATEPHYDIVYMGRGSKRTCTMWTPLSDIPWNVGGLIILENSHRLEDLKASYGTMDVDEVCANQEGARRMNHLGYHGYGALSDNPRTLAETLDRRWLGAEYQMGDILLFSMYTLHCSTDNSSRVIRLSTDSRCQPASEPADERWVGENPIGHGDKARREMIC